MTAVLKINEELNGIELYFEGKPSEEIRSTLKENKFRWSGFKKCWYTKQSETALKVAENITNSTITIEEAQTTNKTKKQPRKAKKEAFNLWNSTRWEEIEVNKETKDKEAKEIAKEIRSHVRKRFPMCKFSVTVPYYGRISFDIKSSPYEKDSKYLQAILNYCENLLNAYKHCYSAADPYTDYSGVYNFTGWASICWEYTQTEATEEIKKDMFIFDTKQAEHEKAEEEKKEKEFQEYMKQQKIRDEEHQKKREEEKKQIENIYNSVDVKELDEKEQYFVVNSAFANLNKNNTLDQYIEEVEKGDYSTENVKITKEVHFDNKEALTNFSNMLLNDFDFLANTGGSFTEDNRINSMLDYYNMDDYEKASVKWNLKGVAVYFDNKLQFIVDAQGYSYARYVGLTDNATIEKTITDNQVINGEKLEELKKQADLLEELSAMTIEELDIISTWENENWNDYKEALKDKLKQYNFKLTKEVIQQLEIESLKSHMYKLLTEVDGIQDQFKNATIEEGEKVTMFYISDFGSIVTNRMTFNSFTPSNYAQYDNAVKVTFKPENKRKLHYTHFYSTLLVFKGWHKLPETVLNNVEHRNGFIVTSSKYTSCDNKQYDEILSYFEQQGIKPIINTYKPSF